MEKLMTKEESYAERRKLFKNIWETAMHMDEKETEIMSKPKVIKTLRLDEVDRINIGKSKKQRIKNLRNVCNKLLDFCDRQDADDVFYEQLASEVGERPQQKVGEPKVKKSKTTKTKRKMRKAKSYPPAGDAAQAQPNTSEGRDDGFSHRTTKTARFPSQNRFKRTTVVKKSTVAGGKNLNPKPSPVRDLDSPTKAYLGDVTPHRKVVKIKHSKRKHRIHKAPPADKVNIN